MATTYKIKIIPDDILVKDRPSFDLKINSSGLIFTDYSWSCLPGYIGAVSGYADFIQAKSLPLFTLWRKEFSQFDEKGENCIYGILYHLSPDSVVGATGHAIMDYSGYALKKRLEGTKNFTQILKAIFTDGGRKIDTKWELIEKY